MRTAYSLKLHGFFLAAAWFAGLSPVASTFANSYIVDLNSKKVTDLGSDVVAKDINDAGQIAGQKSGHAFITGPAGVGMRDLGTLGGAQSGVSGLNDAGQVVGWSDTAEGVRRAFITGPNGVGMKDLGTPADIVGETGNVTGLSISASAINNAGQVVGWFAGNIEDIYPPGRYFMHAFITGPNGAGMRDLGVGGLYGRATGINTAGQVTGDQNNDPFSSAFITGENGTGITLLAGLGGPFDYASGINDTGQVVGVSRTAYSPDTGDADHAFVTGPNGMGTRDLGTLGGDYSHALAINDAGEVVGTSGIAPGDWSNRHAFIADSNSMIITDLNSLVTPPAGVTFTGATAINNMGQVVASGVTAVIPEPESYALMLAGLGLIGFMALRKKIVSPAWDSSLYHSR